MMHLPESQNWSIVGCAGQFAFVSSTHLRVSRKMNSHLRLEHLSGHRLILAVRVVPSTCPQRYRHALSSWVFYTPQHLRFNASHPSVLKIVIGYFLVGGGHSASLPLRRFHRNPSLSLQRSTHLFSRDRKRLFYDG